MNRIDRLTGMILLLQSQRVITAEQVADHFEISVRTVYRDLAALGEAGVPILAEPGVGYSLMRGYHMPPVMFTEDEAVALFLSGEITERVADESLRTALRSALLKVRSVLPHERHDYLNRLRDVVKVETPNSQQEENHQSFMPLQQAVVRKQCVALHYNTAGRGTVTDRMVEPLGLVYYGHHWHLIAYCRLRLEIRDFRLDRIVGWQLVPERFSGHEDFSLKEFLAGVLSGMDSLPVTVIFHKAALDRMYREMPGTPLNQEPLTDHTVKVEMLAFSLHWLANWLLSFGTDMQVLEPLALQNTIAEMAGEILEKHRKTSAIKTF